MLLGAAIGGETEVVDKRKPYVVETEADIGKVPHGTTVVVVREPKNRERNVVTEEGIPVIYPYNDQHDQPSPPRRR